MSMIIELFGEEILSKSKDEVKAAINELPRVQQERYSYLLHDWSRLTGIEMSEEDYEDVDGIPQKSLADIGR